jgi:hypothetical protein
MRARPSTEGAIGFVANPLHHRKVAAGSPLSQIQSHGTINTLLFSWWNRDVEMELPAIFSCLHGINLRNGIDVRWYVCVCVCVCVDVCMMGGI